MDNIQEFKANFDIVSVASDLNCLPPKQGAIYQGNCPAGHESKGGRCFTIFSHTQTAYCFHCGKSFDVINLVETAKSLDFLGACNWLSDTYHVSRLATKMMTDEERIQYEQKIRQQRLIFNILTDAAHFYHEKLMSDKEMKKYLITHYGFNEDTISTYCLGFSSGEGLYDFLLKKGYKQKEIICTGLVITKSHRCHEFYNNRLMFPYWSNGNVVYFIGRKTDRTPDNEYEKAKYKKLPVHSENNSHISEYVNNQWYLGEDSVRGKNKCYVAEGVTDALSLLQHGEPCISPATVRFREADFPRLERLTKNIPVVFLIPDNEESQAGINGAMYTADRLEKLGKTVYIIDLPRPDDQDKIDLNEYFLTHTKNEFDELIGEAKTPFQILIDKIASDNPDPIHLSEKLEPVKEKLAHLPDTVIHSCLNYMKKTLNLKNDYIKAFQKELKDFQKTQKNKERVQVFEGENSNRNHIFEKDGQLWKLKCRPEKLPEEISISSFTIEPIEAIILPEEGETLRVNLKTNHKKTEILLPPCCWSSNQKFVNVLPCKEFVFVGTAIDVQYIRLYLSTFKMPEKRGVRTSGFHNNQFITEEGALSTQGVSKEIVYFNEVKTHCKLISTDSATEEDLLYIKGCIEVGFNIQRVVLPILGWTVACFFKPVISEILNEMGLSNGFPLLNIQGEAGAGKTCTVKDVMMKVWAINHEPKSIGELTRFTMMKLVDGSNSIPIILEENKCCMQSEYHQNLISTLIRSTYNCFEGERGRADQSTQVYRYQAPVVIVGETGFIEPALLDRFIPVFMSKKDSKPFLRNFRRLRKFNLEKLGRSILEKALAMKREEIQKILDEELKKIDPELTDRPRTNAAVVRFGLRILEDVLEMQFDLSKVDEAVKEGIREGDSPYRKSTVDKILDAMSLMSEYSEDGARKNYRYQDHLEEGTDYEVDNNVLKLHTAGAYSHFIKWAKAHSFKETLDQNSFTKQIQKENYFISAKLLWIGNHSKRGVELNIEKMKEKGLELNHLWEENEENHEKNEEFDQ